MKVRMYQWQVRGLSGCCGMAEIYRLKGLYDTDEVAEQRIRERVFEPDALVRECMRATDLSVFFKLYCNELAMPISVEDAFSATLAELYGTAHKTAYVLTDNMTVVGDVHLGPYNTREFVKWLGMNGFGRITGSGPMQSIKQSEVQLQGWIWVPDWMAIHHFVQDPAEIVNRYKEVIHNVQKEGQERVKKANDALVARALAAW